MYWVILYIVSSYVIMGILLIANKIEFWHNVHPEDIGVYFLWSPLFLPANTFCFIGCLCGTLILKIRNLLDAN